MVIHHLGHSNSLKTPINHGSFRIHPLPRWADQSCPPMLRMYMESGCPRLNLWEQGKCWEKPWGPLKIKPIYTENITWVFTGSLHPLLSEGTIPTIPAFSLWWILCWIWEGNDLPAKHIGSHRKSYSWDLSSMDKGRIVRIQDHFRRRILSTTMSTGCLVVSIEAWSSKLGKTMRKKQRLKTQKEQSP